MENFVFHTCRVVNDVMWSSCVGFQVLAPFFFFFFFFYGPSRLALWPLGVFLLNGTIASTARSGILPSSRRL